MNNEDVESALDQVDSPFGQMVFLVNDQFLGRSLKEYGEWAKKELDFLSTLIEPGSVVIDAGAFIGTHTMAFSNYTGQTGKVYSFEPHPVYFKLLERNVKNNQLSNVALCNKGLFDRQGKLLIENMDIHKSNSFGSVKLTEYSDGSDMLSVDVTTIDSLQVDACALVKIDVEGMERSVLAGARSTVEKYKPYIYAECNSADASWPVVEMMRNIGYQIYIYSELAFNDDNYFKNKENIFGIARELGLVCVPAEKDLLFRSNLNARLDIVPIRQLDDMVLALLKKPQYKDEILRNSSGVEFWGVDFWANESELEEKAREFEQLVKHNEQLSAEIAHANEDAQRQIAALTKWATSADTYGKSLVEELSKARMAYGVEKKAYDVEKIDLQEKIKNLMRQTSDIDEKLKQINKDFAIEEATRESARVEIKKISDILVGLTEKVESYGASLFENLVELKTAYAEESLNRNSLNLETLKQIEIMANRANKTEEELKFILTEKVELQKKYEAVCSARVNELEKAQKQIDELSNLVTIYKKHWVFKVFKLPSVQGHN